MAKPFSARKNNYLARAVAGKATLYARKTNSLIVDSFGFLCAYDAHKEIASS